MFKIVNVVLMTVTCDMPYDRSALFLVFSSGLELFKYFSSFIFFILSFLLSYRVRTICNFDFITFMRLYGNTKNEIVYEYVEEGIFLSCVFRRKDLFLLDKKLICHYT